MSGVREGIRMDRLADPVPVDAVDGILAAFSSFPLVALGETHRLQEESDFLTALLHHPAFPDTVDAVVVEFGNALHQPLVDRFVAGEPVANATLRPVWRDVVGSLYGMLDAPMYEQFFRTVRALNRRLPPTKRLRVLLGDPPVDWARATRTEDVQPWLGRRDEHYAEVVTREVLDRGGRALLVAGASHFFRISEFDPRAGVVVQRLERQQPGTSFVALPHCGFAETPEFVALEARLAAWPVESLARLEGTWLGAVDARDVLGAGTVAEWGGFTGRDGQPVERVTLEDIVDAYLYLGPRAALTLSAPNPAIYRGDPAYLAELQERWRLLWGNQLEAERLFAEPGPAYWPTGPNEPAS
jgi:hypothetical protein